MQRHCKAGEHTAHFCITNIVDRGNEEPDQQSGTEHKTHEASVDPKQGKYDHRVPKGNMERTEKVPGSHEFSGKSGNPVKII